MKLISVTKGISFDNFSPQCLQHWQSRMEHRRDSGILVRKLQLGLQDPKTSYRTVDQFDHGRYSYPKVNYSAFEA
jgi:hypothetical protein